MPNPQLGDIQREIENEKAKIALLVKKENRSVSHLGFEPKPVIPIAARSDLSSVSSMGSETLSRGDAGDAGDKSGDKGRDDGRGDASDDASDDGSDYGSDGRARSDSDQRYDSDERDDQRNESGDEVVEGGQTAHASPTGSPTGGPGGGAQVENVGGTIDTARRTPGGPPAGPVRAAVQNRKSEPRFVPQAPKQVLPHKIGANLSDERFGPLREVLKNGGSSRPILLPPPVSKIVAEKYAPGIEQVENAFDALEAWAVRVKNWKLWTLLMDQYGLSNTFPMPSVQPLVAPTDYRTDLHRALTQRCAKFAPCPVLKCKQSMFHEEVHKVIKPWCKTNFSTALMELGDTLCLLLEKIPRGVSEYKPTPELLRFISSPNAAERVYDGTSPVFNPELSRQLTEKIRVETMASKRLFMDSDLLMLKHQTDTNLRTLMNLHAQCNAKTAEGARLDEIHDVYRALEWQNALHGAHDTLNRSFDAVKWERDSLDQPLGF